MHLEENDQFYYDPQAAERPINFIQGYVCHYEDRYAGKPFLLLDWQKELIRNVFGWHSVATKLRRFQQSYIEIGKGAGKSPLLSAIGLYELLAANVDSPQIYSIATDFIQANVTFENAKRFIHNSPKLAKLCDAGKLLVKQFSIEYPKNNGTWKILSGTAEGRHGLRPTCVLFDEVHEQGTQRKLYDAMQSNMTKRSNAVFWMATNAGCDRNSLCWQLHEEAVAVLEGRSTDTTLYPVIYAAGPNDPIDDPATWKKAIPSLGQTITEAALTTEYKRAKANPALEARFRRFFMGQWVQGTDKWLDMAAWDACTKAFRLQDVKELPLYLGLDMSLNDDVSALVLVWVGKERLYVRTRQWIPKGSAQKYEEQDGTPYKQWAKAGFITILDSDTVNDKVQARIARHICKLAKTYNVKCLAYDRYKANRTISLCERQNVPCIDVKQTLDTLSPACFELERRLKERSITLFPNASMRFQAANAEVMTDKNGLMRPVKEASKGKYAGRRGCKIDSVVATVTALTQVLVENRAEAGGNQVWQGELFLI